MRELREALFRIAPLRWLVALVILCRGLLYMALGQRYRGTSDICWVVRVSDVRPLRRLAEPFVRRLVETLRRDQRNTLVDAYRATSLASACAARYSLDGPGRQDIFRDLMVLKRATDGEKGVILLKYARTFDAVVALFDMARLRERYFFVLEPCWAGYCDPSLLMFIALGQPVYVLCFTEEDYDFISRIGDPMVPVRLGPADWTDADRFNPLPGQAKTYDLVMVASWAAGKRHAQLFRALSRITDRKLRVLLIGFPWYGRTAEDIKREAEIVGPNVQIDVLDSVPQHDLAGYLSQCKAFVFLSRKEGDNKSLVEALFVDIPAIVYAETIGGAKSRINPATGILATDDELTEKILFMLDRYQSFSPRAWALEHTGSVNATRVLDEAIRSKVIASGGRYTEGLVEKTNSPNLTYRDPTCRERFEGDYEFIRSCRRDAATRDGR